MPKKSLVFLLDAGPVIRLHELGLWDGVVERAELVLPGTVARQEAHFFTDAEGRKTIDLLAQSSTGAVQVKDADAVDLERTADLFDASIRESVDPGELEALTLIRLWDSPRPRFCTADRLATIALCLLGFADSAVSLERLLEDVGLGNPVGLRRYSEAELQRWLKEGRLRRMTGQGLA